MAKNKITTDNLTKSLNKMHTLFQNKLTQGDVNTAQKAEDFLNWIIFDKGPLKIQYSKSNYREILMQNTPQIAFISNKFNAIVKISNKYKQQYASKSLLTPEEQKQLEAKMGAWNYIRGSQTEKLLVQLVNIFAKDSIKKTGTDSSTVEVKKWSKKLLEEIGLFGEDELKKLVIQNNKIRYAGRSMKADTQTNNAQAEITYNFAVEGMDDYVYACVAALSNTSIKSVNNISRIHLEDVDVAKAYNAFMKFAYSRTFPQKEIKSIFKGLYIGDNIDSKTEKITQDKREISRHLNHLLRVYAYSGFGTAPIEHLNDISRGVAYLIVVDNSAQYISVIPSSKVIKLLLDYNRGDKIYNDIILNIESLIHYR